MHQMSRFVWLVCSYAHTIIPRSFIHCQAKRASSFGECLKVALHSVVVLFCFCDNARVHVTYLRIDIFKKSAVDFLWATFYPREKCFSTPTLARRGQGLCDFSLHLAVCAGSSRTCVHNEDVQVLR